MITQIRRLAKPWQKKNSPGLILEAEKQGVCLFSIAAGYANLDFDIKVDENTVFLIASTSKQFTAACIAMLILQDKISLDDTLAKWFDDFPPYAELITIDMLVHHTSGLRDTLPLKIISGRTHEDYSSLQDSIELIRSQKKLNFEPGSRFLYSNAGYALLAAIVQKATGSSLGEYAHVTFFEPLAMKNTLFDENHSAIVKNRATSYEMTEYGYRAFLKNDDECGASGILTTVSDLMKWNDNLSTGKVGGEAFISLMHTTGKLRDGSDTGYAFGLQIDEKYGQKRIHHAGSYLGFHAQSIRYPEEALTILCLSNSDDVHPANLCDQAYEIIHDLKVTNPSLGRKVTISPVELRKMAGVYKSAKSNWIAEAVLNEQGGLSIKAFNRLFETLALSDHEFIILENNTKLVFGENEKHRMSMNVFMDDVLSDQLEIQEIAGFSDEQLQQLRGKYVSEELNAMYVISTRDNELFVNRRGHILEKLNKGVGDTFILGPSFIEFKRDPSGEVTHFTVSGERIMGIDFTKLVTD